MKNHWRELWLSVRENTPQLSNLWWMSNSVRIGLAVAMKTGSSRRFQRYPTTYMWVSSWLPFTEDQGLSWYTNHCPMLMVVSVHSRKSKDTKRTIRLGPIIHIDCKKTNKMLVEFRTSGHTWELEGSLGPLVPHLILPPWRFQDVSAGVSSQPRARSCHH